MCLGTQVIQTSFALSLRKGPVWRPQQQALLSANVPSARPSAPAAGGAPAPSSLWRTLSCTSHTPPLPVTPACSLGYPRDSSPGDRSRAGGTWFPSGPECQASTVLTLFLQAHCGTSSCRLPGPNSSSAQGLSLVLVPHGGSLVVWTFWTCASMAVTGHRLTSQTCQRGLSAGICWPLQGR